MEDGDAEGTNEGAEEGAEVGNVEGDKVGTDGVEAGDDEKGTLVGTTDGSTFIVHVPQEDVDDDTRVPVIAE